MAVVQLRDHAGLGRPGAGRVQLDALTAGIYPAINGHLSSFVTFISFLHLGNPSPDEGESSSPQRGWACWALTMPDSCVATARVGNLGPDGQIPRPVAASSQSSQGCCGSCAPLCPRPGVAAVLSPLQTSPEEDFQPPTRAAQLLSWSLSSQRL